MVSNVFGRRLGNLGRDQEVVAEHELFVEAESILVLRKFIPHRSNDGGTCFGCVLESCIEVMNLGVSLVNCIPDYLLDSFRSEPGFTVE